MITSLKTFFFKILPLVYYLLFNIICLTFHTIFKLKQQHQDPVDSGIPPPVETDVEETVRVHQDPVDAGPSATQTSGDPGGNNEVNI